MYRFKRQLQLLYRVLVKYPIRKHARKSVIDIHNAVWNSTRNTVEPKKFNTSYYTSVTNREK